MVLFRSLDDQELVELLTCCMTKKYPAKENIFSEGDPASKFYMIKDGEVRISKMIPGVGEEALAVLKPGDIFGEMALIDEHTRSAFAIAHSDCTLMEIAIKDMQAILKSNQAMAAKILMEFCKVLAARLRNTNDKFYGLFAMSAFFK